MIRDKFVMIIHAENNESSKTEKQTQGHKTARLMHILLQDLARENKSTKLII